MPIDQSEAIVLRTFPVGDQDKIAVFFSRDKGLLRGIAKGARKFGNRFGSSLEPMSLVRVFYYEKERKDLLTVSQCDLIESFFEVYKDYKTSCTLAYFAELIEEFFPSPAKEDVLFRLLLSALQAVKAGGDLEQVGRYFEAWFLKISGLLPDFRHCKGCHEKTFRGAWLSPKMDGVYCGSCAPFKKEEISPDMMTFLSWVRKNPPPASGVLPFTTTQIASFGRTLQGLIVFHLEKEPKSLHCLKDEHKSNP